MDALKLFFCKDQQLIDYVQLVVGMAAIGKVYQEHMIIAYGGGCQWVTIDFLEHDFPGSGRLRREVVCGSTDHELQEKYQAEMAELKGRRLIISSEMRKA